MHFLIMVKSGFQGKNLESNYHYLMKNNLLPIIIADKLQLLDKLC